MTAEHWDRRYADAGATGVSWFEEYPATSMELIAEVSEPRDSLVDVGGGASTLVDALLARGHRDITVVDLSASALATALERVGDAPVTWIAEDVRAWQPLRTFDVWHDRAALHFLVDADDRTAYWDLVRASVPAGGHVVVGVFAADGPETCSGLPVVRYSPEQLVASAGAGFAALRTLRRVHVTPAGAEQPFSWAVLTRTP